jgi:hypothetical protein
MSLSINQTSSFPPVYEKEPGGRLLGKVGRVNVELLRLRVEALLVEIGLCGEVIAGLMANRGLAVHLGDPHVKVVHQCSGETAGRRERLLPLHLPR